jgi:hypothetical protein
MVSAELSADARKRREATLALRARAQASCERTRVLIERSAGAIISSPRATAFGEAPSLSAEGLMAEVANLRAALATRDLIWEAKLIIAAATGCDAEHAQRLLVQQSQHENRKLRDIAAEMVKRSHC